MLKLLAIATGGALGALGRYWVVGLVTAWLGRAFPFGTLAVNVAGSLLIGVLYIIVVQQLRLAPEWQAILMVGFTGAFTTFSTFSLETLKLLQEGQWPLALLYVGASLALCLLAVAAGMGLGKWLT